MNESVTPSEGRCEDCKVPTIRRGHKKKKFDKLCSSCMLEREKRIPFRGTWGSDDSALQQKRHALRFGWD